MHVLIVEDEMLLAKQLAKLLQEVAPDAVLAGTCHSVQQTVKWLQENPAPDLVLMDIEIADGQSFDIFTQVQLHTPVIFTTAYDEYALRAFKVNSIDYLLKPIRKNELEAAIGKFRNMHRPSGWDDKIAQLLQQMQQWKAPEGFRTRFLVKQGQKLVSIETKDIAYFYSEGGYSYLVTNKNQKFIVDYSLDELEHSLPPTDFFRANRQSIISQRSVVAIHPWFNQKLKVDITPAPADQLVISRDKASEFKQWMGS